MPTQEEFITSLERAYCSLYDTYSHVDDALRFQAVYPSICVDVEKLKTIKIEAVKLRIDIHVEILRAVLKKG